MSSTIRTQTLKISTARLEFSRDRRLATTLRYAAVSVLMLVLGAVGGTPGRANRRNLLLRQHEIASAHEQLRAVPIEGLQSVTVVDHDRVAVRSAVTR